MFLEERAAARPPRRARSELCTRPAGRAGHGVAARVELGQVGLVAEGEARRGSHPRMRSRTLAFFPLPPFLKAKAVIYSPFRFWECSLRELNVQTPPQGAGEREVERQRPGTSGAPRPSAPLVLAHSGPRRAQLGLKSTNLSPSPQSLLPAGLLRPLRPPRP